MNKVISNCFISLFFLCAASTPLFAGDSEGARAGIGQTIAAWEAALNSGDSAGVAAQYTEDGQILPPNSGTLTGHEAIQATWQGLIDAGFTAKLETVELEVHGHTATEVGAATLFAADGTTVDVAKFIVLWKQVDGEWKLHRDIWNSSAPLPAPEPDDTGSE